MSAGPIVCASRIPLNVAPGGTVPDVSGAMQDYFQPMTFETVGKVVNGFQVIETGTSISFQGIIQPFSPRQLLLKPEGQRAWSWYFVHALTGLDLSVDDVMLFHSKQYRVMAKKDETLYGYLEYHLVTDYTGAGPY